MKKEIGNPISQHEKRPNALKRAGIRVGMTALALSGLVLPNISCSDKNTSSAANINTVVSTTENETPTRIQKEQSKSVEQQAQEFALRTWLNLWSSPRSEIGDGSYPTQAPNIDITNTSIEDVISRQGNLGVPLNISWAGGTLHIGGLNKVEGIKWAGEAQIDKIRTQANGFVPTSDADRANGLQWVGGTNISYIIRSRANIYWPSGGEWGSNRDAVEKWLVSKDGDTDLPAFSEWRQDSFSMRFQIKNGILQIISTDAPNTHTDFGFNLPSVAINQARRISYNPKVKFP